MGGVMSRRLDVKQIVLFSLVIHISALLASPRYRPPLGADGISGGLTPTLLFVLVISTATLNCLRRISPIL